jgi:heptosyltransferase II
MIVPGLHHSSMDAHEPVAKFRVVVPVVAGVGNALLAVPMVRQLKEKRPGSRITVIARINAMAEVFRRMPEVEQVLVTGSGLRGLWRMVRWTRQQKPDLYLVPFPSNRWQYNLLAAISGAGQRVLHRFPVGYLRALGFLPADRVPAERGIHDVQQNLRLLAAVGIDARLDERPRFNVTDVDRARADGLLHAAGVTSRASFVAVHPGSGQTVIGKAKRWPPVKYARWIAEFSGSYPHTVVLLEGPDEPGVADEILRACRESGERTPRQDLRVVRLSGPLGDAAAVLERAALYVGSDSGLAHLASAVGTGAVTIFAPADPDRVCPSGYRHLVVRPDKACSPCVGYPWQTPYPTIRCREPMCVNEVAVSSVMEAVHRAMAPLHVLPESPDGSGRTEASSPAPMNREGLG